MARKSTKNSTQNSKKPCSKKPRPSPSERMPPKGRESKARRAERCTAILAELHRLYPEVECALEHKNAFELLAATMLSAQCTDKTVNSVTPALFARYPDAEAMAEASIESLEKLVYSTGFYRNKAKNLKAMAARLVAVHDSVVPQSMDELLELPGVARKTANVVLGSFFGIAVGIVVDTHVGRLARRLAWTREKGAVPVERELCALIPDSDWIWLSHALIWHGRLVCDARKPRCHGCSLAALCPSAALFEGPAVD